MLIGEKGSFTLWRRKYNKILRNRGFTGQTPEWIEKWITGEEDSAVETSTIIRWIFIDFSNILNILPKLNL